MITMEMNTHPLEMMEMAMETIPIVATSVTEDELGHATLEVWLELQPSRVPMEDLEKLIMEKNNCLQVPHHLPRPKTSALRALWKALMFW